MQNNKFGTYLFYAFGEIILVVIGILIALYLDNLNTNKKSKSLKERYKVQLTKDLAADTVFINDYLNYLEQTTRKWQNLKERVINPNTTIDTVIKIHKNEFDFIYEVLPGFNRNTYTAIQATGNWDVFEDSMINEITGFYNLQEIYLKDIRLNEEPYSEDVQKLTKRFPLEAPFIFFDKGSLFDELWDSAQKSEYLSLFNSMATSKGIYLYFTKERLLMLKKETSELLQKI